MVSKRKVKKVSQWAVALAAYIFLIYTLLTFDHYADLWRTFASASCAQYRSLVACLLLMPINLLLEAWKWRSLLKNIEPLTIREAQRQVYYGAAGAFVTPYRIGDYPARALLLKDKEHYLPAIGMAVVGSAVLTLVILLVGIVACIVGIVFDRSFMPSEINTYLTLVLSVAAVLLLLLLALPLITRKYKITYNDCSLFMLQSLLRYICFCCQLWLSFCFCGVSLPVHYALIGIPVYYLFVTITPNMPVADIGIRGSWAVLVFGYFLQGAQANIILATTVLWIINTLLPVLVGAVGIRYSKSA